MAQKEDALMAMKNDGRMYRRQAGYCFELVQPAVGGSRWMAADDDGWEIVVADADPGECWVGQRRIDGSTCQVFRGVGGVLRAATTVSCHREPVRGAEVA